MNHRETHEDIGWSLHVKGKSLSKRRDHILLAVKHFYSVVNSGADEVELVFEGAVESLTWTRGEATPDAATWLARVLESAEVPTDAPTRIRFR